MRTTAEVLLWITPKIFDDLCRPAAAVGAFFDHYRDWIDGRRATILFAAGNGDHVLNYAGRGGRLDRFDWARYNAFAPGHDQDRLRRDHNRDWLDRVREGGERSENPYAAGPMMILSEQVMDYEVLAGIYATVRAEAESRNVDIRLLEYLDPSPERCASEWKRRRHPEVSQGAGSGEPGVIDTTVPLRGDGFRYAAWPDGIPEGLPAGDFAAAQAAAFCADFGLDGVLLGDQFGLVGLRDPANAPEPTDERRAGVERFFTQLRERMGNRLVYWMDTHWPAEVEREAWCMTDAAYASLDAIVASAGAVPTERGRIVPNLRSKSTLSGPSVIMGLDFVDPWRWHRAYLDDRRTYLCQREVLEDCAELIDGVTFFANDTFGQFVRADPLAETLATLSRAEKRAS
ncbi:hypothetical protein L0U85_16445 [Glycomyces sp. L485]|uniref:hypothetical protein n=1 Tax=Glycomyces sp. L485 TaxID=2909235 RepID=UPI001F4A8CD0|nr:hypothetical protein [Glycomyces sp. L485]MCH7232430.1 hypothetical protein [Glycomyces sp. L485]